jgi:hypothetical protein
VHGTEGSLARRHQPIFDVIIGVVVSARLVQQGNSGQSLEVCGLEVKQVAQRGG